MGHYLQTPESNTNKARILSEKYGGILVNRDDAMSAYTNNSFDVVCVIHNFYFEAALCITNYRDYESIFNNPLDNREKEYVLFPLGTFETILNR